MPIEWDSLDEPPYSYWCYYLYANITAINHLRRARGLNTFWFKPHCGESGNPDHLGSAFLTAHGISQGIKLRASPVLQYLYYLKNIGIATAPLSNNKLFIEFSKNPFPKFMKRGLNVSLSTDDPLIIHLTDEPFIEEISIAHQIWNLSQVDIVEVLTNGILQSVFPMSKKRKWLGAQFLEEK